MNNDELEVSLRTEINNYLKSAFADIRQEIEQAQSALETEFARHRNQVEEAFNNLLARDIQSVKVDDDLASLVAEHLRFAREEGANSMAEMVPQAQEEAVPAAASQKPFDGFAKMGEAISEISAQTSQAEILKALVKHAGNFAPRGAFFIVKSDHLVGWRTFGEEAGNSEDVIREVFLPLTGNSILSASIKNQTIQHGSAVENTDNAQFLDRLGFGAESGEVVALPLIVRGRGVAVLYADSGENGNRVEIDALESLVRVASMTVELMAASRSAQLAPARTVSQPAPQKLSSFTEKPAPSFKREPEVTAYKPAIAPVEQPAPVAVAVAPSYEPEPVTVGAEAHRAINNSVSQPARVEFETAYETFSFSDSESQTAKAFNDEASVQVVESSRDFNSSFTQFAPQTQSEPEVESQPQSFAPAQENAVSFNNYSERSNPVAVQAQPAPQPVVEVVPSASSPRRFGDRNVDLPIEVPEDQRRLHNDARRFARLLVSEIKLYNEQKVKEGRQANDLYERLREAIDRSREMYDKRVSPPVAAKFDYFHFELINTLAEGDEARLGTDYPGATA